MARYVVLDFERSGLFEGDANAPRDQIIAVGAVEVLDGQIGAQQEWLCNPGTKIPSFSRKIHGLTQAMLADAPDFGVVGPQLLEFIGDASVFLHGRHNDMTGWNSDSRRHGLPLFDPMRVFCTLRGSRHLGPSKKQDLSLDALCDLVGVDRSDRAGHHGALIDAQLLAHCVVRIGADILCQYRLAPRAPSPKPSRFSGIGIHQGQVVFGFHNQKCLTAPLPSIPDTHEFQLCAQKRNVLVRPKGTTDMPYNPLGAAVLCVVDNRLVYRTLTPAHDFATKTARVDVVMARKRVATPAGMMFLV